MVSCVALPPADLRLFSRSFGLTGRGSRTCRSEVLTLFSPKQQIRWITCVIFAKGQGVGIDLFYPHFIVKCEFTEKHVLIWYSTIINDRDYLLLEYETKG